MNHGQLEQHILAYSVKIHQMINVQDHANIIYMQYLVRCLKPEHVVVDHPRYTSWDKVRTFQIYWIPPMRLPRWPARMPPQRDLYKNVDAPELYVYNLSMSATTPSH